MVSGCMVFGCKGCKGCRVLGCQGIPVAHAKALNANDIRGPIVRAQYKCSLERESTHHPARTVLDSAL